jgi:arginase family enzyme
VYIHFDPDVLDPSVFPTSYARPNGLTAASARNLVQTVAEHNPILGVELTAFHSPDDPTARHELAGWLLDIVGPLLTPRSQPVVL